MGQHSLPDGSAPAITGSRPPARRRTLVLACGLALAVVAGSVVALRSGVLPFGGPCDGNSTRLAVAAAPDIAPALEAVARTARDGAIRTDGACLDVEITARAAHDLADAFAQRPADPEFQVWIPDSSLWTARVGAERGTPLTTAATLASSPVVLGAVPTAATSLGWPARTYRWAELTRAAASAGALRLGIADPARSATGLLALARTGAADGTEGDPDTRAAAAAKLLHQRVADGDRAVTATLARDDSAAARKNPRRNRSLLLSEQAAYAHNTASAGSPRLDLFYPRDGAARLDYPYVLVDDEEMGPEQSRAANRFMTLLGEAEGQRILRAHGFRDGNGGADPTVVRKAGGRAPQPASAGPADPPTGKELQALMGMWTVTVQSTRLTTVVDASASMGTPVPGRGGRTRMELARNALLRTLATCTPDDEFGLWTFATFLDGARDYTEVSPTGRLGARVTGGGTHRDTLTAALHSLTPVARSGAGLYDTTLAAYEQARATYASGKVNALVLVTDGANDDAGSIGLDSLVARLTRLADPERPVPLIALGLGPEADLSALDRIVAPTGGSAHRVDDPAQIQRVILKAVVTAGGKGPR